MYETVGLNEEETVEYPLLVTFFCGQGGWWFVSNGKYSGACIKAEQRVMDS